MKTQKCPYYKNCRAAKECLEAPIFKFWEANKQICVRVGKEHSRAFFKRNSAILETDKLHIIDSSGKELSNQELREKFGQGKGYHSKKQQDKN